MELANFIIGFLALIIAIIALIHSIYYNMVKIKLSDCEVNRVDNDYDWLYDFSISNLSNVSVVIQKIELYSKDGKLLTDNGFDPFKKHQDNENENHSESPFGIPLPRFSMPLDPYWESSPFKSETEIYPASRESFSYYLDEEPVKIKITTDKRIHKFRKHQLFFPHFDKNG
ncbi:hypothetical protein [Streptococcus hyovaginalis]|uniref:hypothetical protein n=1 Tax=Streptococcus hyovaginalis TaxID=149015 RepID=UPI003BF8B3AB